MIMEWQKGANMNTLELFERSSTTKQGTKIDKPVDISKARTFVVNSLMLNPIWMRSQRSAKQESPAINYAMHRLLIRSNITRGRSLKSFTQTVTHYCALQNPPSTFYTS